MLLLGDGRNFSGWVLVRGLLCSGGVALKRKGMIRHSSFHPGGEQVCSALGSHHGVRLHRGQKVMMPIDPGLGVLEVLEE